MNPLPNKKAAGLETIGGHEQLTIGSYHTQPADAHKIPPTPAAPGSAALENATPPAGIAQGELAGMPPDVDPPESAEARAGKREGERRKGNAHRLLAAHRERIVDAGRRALLEAAIKRGWATADDVHAVVTLPDGINGKCLGAVPGLLADLNIIAKDGYVKSTRPVAHARPNIRWKLIDREGAERWLMEHPERTSLPALDPLASPPAPIPKTLPPAPVVSSPLSAPPANPPAPSTGFPHSLFELAPEVLQAEGGGAR